MIPITEKCYLVAIDKENIYVSDFTNLTLSGTIGEPLNVQGYLTKTSAYPLYKDVKDISEDDVIKIFEKE